LSDVEAKNTFGNGCLRATKVEKRLKVKKIPRVRKQKEFGEQEKGMHFALIEKMRKKATYCL